MLSKRIEIVGFCKMCGKTITASDPYLRSPDGQVYCSGMSGTCIETPTIKKRVVKGMLITALSVIAIGVIAIFAIGSPPPDNVVKRCSAVGGYPMYSGYNYYGFSWVCMSKDGVVLKGL